MLDTTLCNSYLSVNLQTIINNMQSIQEDIGPDVECIPVLKDNAYCLGAVPIAKALCTYANVRTIAVAQVCEGVELRQAGLSAPAVLVLGGVPERLFPAAVEYGLQLTVFHPSTVYALEKLAAAQGKRAEVQIKVETGLNRTGAKPGAELGALATALAATLGTGNIIGVSTAIALGGPGAVLWCWLTGVFGIATKYGEALLAVKYRTRGKSGAIVGGPMYTIERGLGWKWLAVIFAAFTVLATFGAGCTVPVSYTHLTLPTILLV